MVLFCIDLNPNMRIFSSLYDTVLRWAAHRHATRYLAGLSFAESSFFPIPPDVMLAPMALAVPERAWFYAGLTTVASVLGGVAGYGIGSLVFDSLTPFLQTTDYWQDYLQVKQWFADWGFWVILLAGFSPIPYKVFTITAGAVAVAFLPFVLASLIGRGARFFLVAGIIVVGGKRMENLLRRYIDVVGWLTVLLFIVILFVVRD